ncbi:BRCT domain-containing protein, partial [Lentinula lateritia]
LTVLEGCTVFVDVWMSDGQDTSSLYIDIAKNMGARVVKRIGPQCTHVVYTSGRERTVEQYFALDEAKRPKAVGASWLRDCKQAAARLDEERYLVDLEEHKPDPTSKIFSL